MNTKIYRTSIDYLQDLIEFLHYGANIRFCNREVLWRTVTKGCNIFLLHVNVAHGDKLIT